MSNRSFPSLTPMYGLGSGSRVVGAISLSCPRTKNGSAARVYNFLKNKVGATEALAYIQYSAFGPFVIKDGKLVYR